MKTITLQTAVMLTINELLKLGSFSAFEVTSIIRLRVDNEYGLFTDIDGVYIDFNDDDITDPHTAIEHKAVKQIVAELYENGLFQATKSYGKHDGKSFIIYTPVDTVQTTTTTYTPPTNPYIDRIDNYLRNHGTATIKQIQSALKINGLTCEEIAKALPLHRAVAVNSAISKTMVLPPV
jgi:hypothetical protein